MRRGFGLVDTVVAITVAALLIIGFLSFLPTALNGQNRVDHRLQANEWAQSELEKQKQQPYPWAPTTRSLGQLLTPDKVELRASLSIQAAGAAAYRIRVTVDWNEGQKPQQTFRETIYCPVAR